MANYFLTECKMKEVMNLSAFDCTAFLVSALVHDIGHGGVNNSYHVNAITEIAINTNNLSVMEHFHAAEAFKIMSKDESNPFKHYERAKFQLLRKMIISLILATDNAKHFMNLDRFKDFISNNSIQPDREELSIDLFKDGEP